VDKFSNHIKNILHGFFLAIGTTIAEPSTVLPLIVNYFGGSSMLVGFFAALLRGGAIVVQLFAAFHAQTYQLMMAAIYFREIMAKIFSHKFRGKSMAYRQFFSAVGGLLSGALAGWILHTFEAPQSYGLLFIISSFIMGFGYLSFSLVDEPKKEEVSKKEKSFKEFLSNSFKLLKADKALQTQITTFLFAYGYLIALPFIILHAQDRIDLDGIAIGSLITTQMIGAMISNFLWGKLSGSGRNRLTAKIAISLQIVAILLASGSFSLYEYMVVFFLVGASIDGNRIASSNLILKLAPVDKRPVYIALQMNIVSLGMFFSILGGVILHFLNYEVLYGSAIVTLLIALYFSFKLKD